MTTALHDHTVSVEQCVKWLKENLGAAPRTAIITGSSGPNNLLRHFEGEVESDELPTPFLTPVTEGHQSKYYLGVIGGERVVWLAGRAHFNEEAYDPYRIVTNLRALAKWGVSEFILTNAVGALNTDYQVGSVCILDDHISSYLGVSPLVGDVDTIRLFGPDRFLDCGEVYDLKYQELARDVAGRRLTVQVNQNTILVGVPGPQIETRAEVRKYARDGDVVGMSVVPEALALHHMGCRVLALSLVTNKSRHSREVQEGSQFSHKNVLEVVQEYDEAFADYIAKILRARVYGLQSIALAGVGDLDG